MSRKEEYKEKNLLYLDEIASEEGIRTLPCGILYKVIFITYIRGYKMKKSKLPKQALIILSIALVLVISTVMWSSAQITQDTEEEVQSTLRDVATQNALIQPCRCDQRFPGCSQCKIHCCTVGIFYLHL